MEASSTLSFQVWESEPNKSMPWERIARLANPHMGTEPLPRARGLLQAPLNVPLNSLEVLLYWGALCLPAKLVIAGENTCFGLPRWC